MAVGEPAEMVTVVWQWLHPIDAADRLSLICAGAWLLLSPVAALWHARKHSGARPWLLGVESVVLAAAGFMWATGMALSFRYLVGHLLLVVCVGLPLLLLVAWRAGDPDGHIARTLVWGAGLGVVCVCIANCWAWAVVGRPWAVLMTLSMLGWTAYTISDLERLLAEPEPPPTGGRATGGVP